MGVFDGTNLRGAEMRRLSREIKLTRWALRAEAVVRAFWPAFVVICLLLAMALLGGFSLVGGTAHLAVLGVFAVAGAAALVFGGMRLEWPGDQAVLDRLDEGDKRRPLAALEDQLAAGKGQADTESVWRAHMRRAAEAAAGLRARAPDMRLADRDTWALRLFAPALLIAGLIGAGSDWSGRLASIADPAPVVATAEIPDAMAPMAEAWARPPGYTGIETVYLTGRDGETPIKLPAGSELTIRVTGLSDLPVIEGGAMAGIESFSSLGAGLSEATGILTGSGSLTVTGGGSPLASWQIEVIPDQPPTIALSEPPKTTVTRALQLDFEAGDDYGVTSAWGEIAPEGHDPEAAKGLPLPPIEFALPLPITRDERIVADTVIRDFTAHPWAGAEVELILRAEDGAGQITATEPIRLTLPARRFSHPMARALAEQRRELALDYGQAIRVLDVLQAITRRPHEIFDKPGPYLGVRIAIRRLAGGVGQDRVAEVAPEVIDLLWQAALGLEDGDLSSALERLRQARENLRQALENGTDEDVRRAMEELRAAMNDYLQQLAEQMRRNPNQQQGQQQQGQQLSQQDLQEMLDRLQQSAEGGLRDQARDMLSELSQMLENLQAAQQGQSQQGQGQQTMEQLQDMIQRQRDLSDRTFDELRRQRRSGEQLGNNQQGQSQQGQQPGQGQPSWGEGQGRGEEHGQQGQQGQQGQPGQGGPQQGQGGLAAEQDALQRELDALTRGLEGRGGDEAAQALQDAVRSMQDAARDLRDGANGDAVQDQMDALDRLNQGAEALAEQMQQGQGDQQAQGNQRGQGQSRDNAVNDPFDRPSQSFGALDGRSTKVPNQALIDRARELMQELRRRSAQPQRPQMELDYLERLMDQF